MPNPLVAYGSGSESDAEVGLSSGTALNESAPAVDVKGKGPATTIGVRLAPTSQPVSAAASPQASTSTPRSRHRSRSPPVALDEPVAGPSRLIERPTEPATEPTTDADAPFRLARFGFRPPSTTARCDPELEAKLAHFHQLSAQGLSFNASLTRNKAFRNPHILAKLIEFVSVDESGSNLDPAVWDRDMMMREGNAVRLAERQKQCEDERAASQQPGKRRDIGFTPSTAPAPSAPAPSSSRDRPRDRDRDRGRDERKPASSSSSSRWNKRESGDRRHRDRSRSPHGRRR